MKNRTSHPLVLALVATIVFTAALARAEKPASSNPPATTAVSTSAKFEKEIATYEAADRTSPRCKRAALFVGDSGIKKWTTLAEGSPGEPRTMLGKM